MTVKAGWSTPMLHVADVERSLRFYALLGFEVIDVDRDEAGVGWARMHCEGGALMFLEAEDTVRREHHTVLFAMYTPDLPAFRAHLLAHGLAPGPIGHPPYMPSGEMRVDDPDGYVILVNHWGDTEHAAWLARIGRRGTA